MDVDERELGDLFFGKLSERERRWVGFCRFEFLIYREKRKVRFEDFFEKYDR